MSTSDAQKSGDTTNKAKHGNARKSNRNATKSTSKAIKPKKPTNKTQGSKRSAVDLSTNKSNKKAKPTNQDVTKRAKPSTTTEAPRSKNSCSCATGHLNTNMFTELNVVVTCFSRKYIEQNYTPCTCFKCGVMWVDKVLPTDPPLTMAITTKTRIVCCVDAVVCKNECQRAYCGKCYDELLCDHKGVPGKDEPTILTMSSRRSRG